MPKVSIRFRSSCLFMFSLRLPYPRREKKKKKAGLSGKDAREIFDLSALLRSHGFVSLLSTRAATHLSPKSTICLMSFISLQSELTGIAGFLRPEKPLLDEVHGGWGHDRARHLPEAAPRVLPSIRLSFFHIDFFDFASAGHSGILTRGQH